MAAVESAAAAPVAALRQGMLLTASAATPCPAPQPS